MSQNNALNKWIIVSHHLFNNHFPPFYRCYGSFQKGWCAGSWWCSPCAFRALFWWWPFGPLSEMTTGGLRWRPWGPSFCSMPCSLSAVWYDAALTWHWSLVMEQGRRCWLVAGKSFLIKKEIVLLKKLQSGRSSFFKRGKNCCQSDFDSTSSKLNQ